MFRHTLLFLAVTFTSSHANQDFYLNRRKNLDSMVNNNQYFNRVDDDFPREDNERNYGGWHDGSTKYKQISEKDDSMYIEPDPIVYIFSSRNPITKNGDESTGNRYLDDYESISEELNDDDDPDSQYNSNDNYNFAFRNGLKRSFGHRLERGKSGGVENSNINSNINNLIGSKFRQNYNKRSLEIVSTEHPEDEEFHGSNINSNVNSNVIKARRGILNPKADKNQHRYGKYGNHGRGHDRYDRILSYLGYDQDEQGYNDLTAKGNFGSYWRHSTRPNIPAYRQSDDDMHDYDDDYSSLEDSNVIYNANNNIMPRRMNVNTNVNNNVLSRTRRSVENLLKKSGHGDSKVNDVTSTFPDIENNRAEEPASEK